MFKSNYHTHTHRCNHADGEDEDYVLEAVMTGIRNLGFSDHIMLPGFSEPRVRGEYDVCQDYLASIESLKKKYKTTINIFTGFEAEGFEYYFPYYRELLDSGSIDYLILGNHCMMNDKRQIIMRFGQPTNASMFAYRDTAVEALKTGLFSAFAHPDYFMSSLPYFDRDVMKVSKDLIETAIAMDVPLEINVGGIRNGKKRIGEKMRYVYPNPEFFILARKMGAKFVFGIDAHSPTQISDDAANSLAVRFAREYDLQVMDKIDFKKI